MSSADLLGCVVIVEVGDEEAGAKVARNLAARGAAVVVAGTDEKKLGVVVGEIAASGGKARHAVGELSCARDKAMTAFGSIAFVVTRESQIDAQDENAIALELIRAWRDRASPSKYR
ncbi:MAG: hypothetical protein ACREJX_11920 [Polyangiaceae bacterium]